MKLIIAGSRGINSLGLVTRILNTIRTPITEVVCGKAVGVDTMGELWAKIRGIPVAEFPADWKRYGKSAGMVRNRQMVDYVGTAGAVVAVHDGTSPGTAMMIDLTTRAGLKLWVPDPAQFQIDQPVQIVNRYHRLPFDIYAGRGSEWGNPYSHLDATTAQFKVRDRITAVLKYREHLLNNPELLSRVGTFRGKTACCYCFPLSCHLHVIADLAENGLANPAWLKAA